MVRLIIQLSREESVKSDSIHTCTICLFLAENYNWVEKLWKLMLCSHVARGKVNLLASAAKYRSIVRKYFKKWLSIYLPLSWCEHRIVPCICGKKCKFEEPTDITHFSLVELVSIKLYRTIFSPFSSEWELFFYPDWIALLKLGHH